MKQHDLSLQWQMFIQRLASRESWKLVLAFVLVFFNWGIEAIKWKQVISPIQKMTFVDAFNAILAGVAFALNTPNRIGEYGARILYIEEGKRAKAISLTLVSSLSQLLVTILFGCLALLFMHQKLSDAFIAVQNLTFRGFEVISVLLAISVSLVYFRIAWIVKLLERLPFVKRFSGYIANVKELSSSILWKAFFLSVFRYIVFIVQYILLLQVMHVEMPIWVSMGIISILFLCLAIIPSVALLELGIRWQLGIMLFGIYSQNTIGIYMVASFIWFFNLLIPAIAGSLSILRIRIFKVTK